MTRWLRDIRNSARFRGRLGGKKKWNRCIECSSTVAEQAGIVELPIANFLSFSSIKSTEGLGIWPQLNPSAFVLKP